MNDQKPDIEEAATNNAGLYVIVLHQVRVGYLPVIPLRTLCLVHVTLVMNFVSSINERCRQSVVKI